MNHAKSNAIFYIDADNGFYYGGSQMLTLAFPRDVIADQDILNREKFHTLLKSFIETNKLEPSNVVLVFAPGLCYDKVYDTTTALTEKDNQEIKSFLEVVPFEDVLSKQYKIAKKISISCVNRDLAMAVKLAFEKDKFTVTAVVPYTLLQLIIPELAENVDFDLMLSRFDSLKQHNMIDITQVPSSNNLSKVAKPKKNNRVFALLGVFGVLIVIMVYMFYNTFMVPQPKLDGTIGGSRKASSPSKPNTPVRTSSDPTGEPGQDNTVPLQNNPAAATVNPSTPSAQ